MGALVKKEPTFFLPVLVVYITTSRRLEGTRELRLRDIEKEAKEVGMEPYVLPTNEYSLELLEDKMKEARCSFEELIEAAFMDSKLKMVHITSVWLAGAGASAIAREALYYGYRHRLHVVDKLEDNGPMRRLMKMYENHHKMLRRQSLLNFG